MILVKTNHPFLRVRHHRVYLLPEEVHHKIDSTRANFYWDTGQKKRYNMVKWADLAKPKDFGGLGFIDTRLMNTYLLSKWIIKLERVIWTYVQGC
jgi:hypothetical protein